MDRYWFLTNTCYGNWLPGDSRGFVGHILEHRPGDPDEDKRVVHSLPGTQYDGEMPGLEVAARERMKGSPIHLTLEQAQAVFTQFQETGRFRGWSIEAAAIMYNHFHLVVGVSGDPDPAKILGDFKSWGTRALTKKFGEPASKTWWTQGGSKRKLPDERALIKVIYYVLYKQPKPLLTWSPTTGFNPLEPTTGASGAA
jgi:REP element-mobilizing transposase RayT